LKAFRFHFNNPFLFGLAELVILCLHENYAKKKECPFSLKFFSFSSFGPFEKLQKDPQAKPDLERIISWKRGENQI